jgi:hypothetical protein
MTTQKDESFVELVFLEMIEEPDSDFFIYGIQATLLKLMKPDGW